MVVTELARISRVKEKMVIDNYDSIPGRIA